MLSRSRPTTESAAPTSGPRKLADDPAYAAAAGKLAELEVDLREVSRQADAVALDLMGGPVQRVVTIHRDPEPGPGAPKPPDGWQPPTVEVTRMVPGRAPDPVSNADEAARALLAGEPVPEITLDAGRKRLRDLRERQQVLERAVALQQQTVDRERQRVSRLVCDARRPEHAEIMRRFTAAMLELGEALEAERDFRDELIADGVRFGPHFRAMPFKQAGDPRSRYGALSQWITEAREFGMLDNDAIPIRWRRAWGEVA